MELKVLIPEGKHILFGKYVEKKNGVVKFLTKREFYTERFGNYLIYYDPKEWTPTNEIYHTMDGVIIAKFAKPKGTLTVWPDKTKRWVNEEEI